MLFGPQNPNNMEQIKKSLMPKKVKKEADSAQNDYI
jgi:hypothetical protein